MTKRQMLETMNVRYTERELKRNSKDQIERWFDMWQKWDDKKDAVKIIEMFTVRIIK